MRVWRAVGVVLLFASVLANVLLIARGVGRASSDDRRSAALPQEQTRAHAELVAQRERIAVLRERIRELESRAAAPGQNALSAPAAEDRGSLYRDRFRRSLPLVGEGVSYSAPDSYLPVYEAHLELFRASVARVKNPAGYAECLRELFDALLEDGSMKLGAEQSKELRRILDDYREALQRASSDSVAERTLRDLETEASVMTRARTLLDEEQLGRMREVLGTLGLFVQAMESHDLNYGFPDDALAFKWMNFYRLDETQKPALLSAARVCAEALREVEVRYRGRGDFYGTGTPEGYEIRLRMLEAQLSALKTLENVLTPEQKQRVNSQLPIEFRLPPPPQPEK